MIYFCNKYFCIQTQYLLIFQFCRLVDEIQPKMFLYENVRGLYTHDGGNTWKVIQSTFDELNYQYKFDLLNAKDYGIPQNRRRLYVVGYKEKYLKKIFLLCIIFETAKHIQSIRHLTKL